MKFKQNSIRSKVFSLVHHFCSNKIDYEPIIIRKALQICPRSTYEYIRQAQKYFDKNENIENWEALPWFDPVTALAYLEKREEEEDILPPQHRYFYRGSFIKWFRRFIMPHLYQIEDDGKQVTYRLGKIHEQLIKHLDEHANSLILLPRGHLKTTIVSFYSLYSLLQYKVKSVNIVCASIEKARETYAMLKEHLENNEELLQAYGTMIDKNRKNDSQSCYLTSASLGQDYPSLTCCTLLGKRITGTHPDLLIADDIQEEPLSPATAARMKYAWDQKARPAVMSGKIVVIGTFKGHDEDTDIYLWLMSKKFDDVSSYPALLSPAIIEGRLPEVSDCRVETRKGKKFYTCVNPQLYTPLWPQCWTIHKLLRKRFEMQDKGEDTLFWSEYMLQPQNPRGRYFDIERLDFISFNYARSIWNEAMDRGFSVCGWVDPGGATGHGYALIVGVKMHGHVYFLDMNVVRASPEHVVREMRVMSNKWDIGVWGWEGNFKQKSEAEMVQRYIAGGLNIQPFNNRGEKIRRIMTAWEAMIGSALSEEKRVHINKEAKGISQFMREFRTFPYTPEGRLAPNQSHEFDIMDAGASVHHHLFSRKKNIPLLGI